MAEWERLLAAAGAAANGAATPLLPTHQIFIFGDSISECVSVGRALGAAPPAASSEENPLSSTPDSHTFAYDTLKLGIPDHNDDDESSGNTRQAECDVLYAADPQTALALLSVYHKDDESANALIIVVADLSRPWRTESSLRRWLQVARDFDGQLAAADERLLSIEARWKTYGGRSENTDLGKEILQDPIRIPTIIALTHSAFESTAFREEQFDVLQYNIRCLCLRTGASLVHMDLATSTQNTGSLVSLVEDTFFSDFYRIDARVGGRETLVIPAGYDTLGKLTPLLEHNAFAKYASETEFDGLFQAPDGADNEDLAYIEDTEPETADVATEVPDLETLLAELYGQAGPTGAVPGGERGRAQQARASQRGSKGSTASPTASPKSPANASDEDVKSFFESLLTSSPGR